MLRPNGDGKGIKIYSKQNPVATLSNMKPFLINTSGKAPTTLHCVLYASQPSTLTLSITLKATNGGDMILSCSTRYMATIRAKTVTKRFTVIIHVKQLKT